MNRLLRHLAWAPPFLVGFSAAVGGELAIGLLLYSTPGFLRALTFIVAVLLGSLSLGLWTTPSSPTETLTESIRRRWLLALVAFGGGSAVSGAWSAQGGLATDAVTRGIGLALLAALPLYSCGALLGAMAVEKRPLVRPNTLGAYATAGAALGTILAGYVLVSVLLPVSMYAFCLVLLSIGALVHGWLIAAAGERRTVYSRASPYGPVEIHEWVWGKEKREVVLVENGRMRGGEDIAGLPIRRWERATLELLARLPQGEGMVSSLLHERSQVDEAMAPSTAVLFLGGGTLTVPRHLLARLPHARVDAVERNRAVMEYALEHFSRLREGPQLHVVHADPLVGLERCPGPYAAIVIDAGAVAPQDPLPLLERRALDKLAARLRPGGLLLCGGIDRRGVQNEAIEALLSEARQVFPLIALYRGSGEDLEHTGAPGHAPELMLVFSADASAELPESAGELTRESVTRVELPTHPVDLVSDS